MNTIDVLKYGQQTILRTVEGFPASGVEIPGACGFWTVKDIIAHLTSYELLLVDVLSPFAGEPATHYLDRKATLGEQFNDAEVRARQGKTMKEVLDEFNAAYTRVMALAGRIPPEKLGQTGTIPWYGLEYSLEDYIVYTFYGHKREHSAQIAAFHDLLDGKTVSPLATRQNPLSMA